MALLLLVAACCVPHAAAAEAAVPSASFVVTQAGMNNAPALYAAFLADAIAEANAKMREPNYWCSVAAGQDGCSGCTCHERNTGVDVAAHMDRIRGARPPELGADITWRDGDFFALAGRPEDGSVQIEILDRDAAGAYVGAVRLTTMIGKMRIHFLDSFFFKKRRKKKRGKNQGWDSKSLSTGAQSAAAASSASAAPVSSGSRAAAARAAATAPTSAGAPKLLITPIFHDSSRFFPVFPWTSGRASWIPGFLASRRRKWAKNGGKWVKNG